MVFWAAGMKRKGEKKKKRWAVWAEKERKKKTFPFLKRFKHIKFKFKPIRIQI